MQDIREILAGLEEDLTRDPAALAKWVERHPHHSEALASYVAYRALLGEEIPASPPDRVLEERFRSHARNAWKRLQESETAAARAPVAAKPLRLAFAERSDGSFATLLQTAAEAGLTLTSLAARMRLSVAEVMKLDRRLFIPETVPASLQALLARLLGCEQDRIADYLRREPMLAAGASYRSKRVPQASARQDFRSAIETNTALSEEDRAYWLAEAETLASETG